MEKKQTARKYKRISVGKKLWPERFEVKDKRGWKQLKALRDIPEHGVKKGDLGGFVNGWGILSQKGSCWIGENAMVSGNVKVTDEAYVGGNAAILNNFSNHTITIKDNASVKGNSILYLARFDGESYPPGGMVIGDKASISGDCTIVNVASIEGRIKIYGKNKLERCDSITGDVEIFGNASIHKGTRLAGDTKVYDDAVVDPHATVVNSIVRGAGVVSSYETVQNLIIDVNGRKVKNANLPSSAYVVQALPASEGDKKALPAASEKALSDALIAFNEVKGNIASYETDIVKILKYPVMTDRTDPFTRAMAKAVTVANRLSAKPESPEFAKAVSEVEDAFLAAESNALKVASTMLSDGDKKRAEKAKDLLAIAANEASTEQEKKVSFKQAFKQLEGVLVVPEEAIDNFRIQIGLKEIEV